MYIPKYKIGDVIKCNFKGGDLDAFQGPIVEMDFYENMYLIKRDDGMSGGGANGTWKVWFRDGDTYFTLLHAGLEELKDPKRGAREGLDDALIDWKIAREVRV